MEKDDPDLFKKIYEPKPKIDILVTEVTQKLNLVEENETEAPNATALAIPVASEVTAGTTGEDGEKKHQSRGGKGLIKDESAKLDKEAQNRAVNYLTLSVLY